MTSINVQRKTLWYGIVAGAMSMFAFPAIAGAMPGTQVVVTPTNTQGWFVGEQDSGAVFTYNNDTTAPGSPSNGALELTTNSTTASHIQYLHPTNTALADVSELEYSTKQISALLAGGDPSYQLAMCMTGISGSTCNNFTTLVYEPYENGVVTNGTWQNWDVMAGQVWSSHSIGAGTCQLTKSQGEFVYSIAALQTACPNAVVAAFGVNVGSNNPSYDVEADLVDFNGTTYNFEPFAAVTNKDACKDGGWMKQVDAHDNGFKNQGDCVSFVASNGQSDN